MDKLLTEVVCTKFKMSPKIVCDIANVTGKMEEMYEMMKAICKTGWMLLSRTTKETLTLGQRKEV